MHPYPVSFGKGEGSRRYADSGKSDKAMKCRDQLRQRGHLNVQRDVSTSGNLLSLNGNRYLKGIGAHTNSTIHYDLGGACSALGATVGVDDEIPAGTGSADFQVWADGRQIFGSGHMTGGSPPQPVNVDLTGVQDLALMVVDDGYAIGNSHADWAGAFLRCSTF